MVRAYNVHFILNEKNSYYFHNILSLFASKIEKCYFEMYKSIFKKHYIKWNFVSLAAIKYAVEQNEFLFV